MFIVVCEAKGLAYRPFPTWEEALGYIIQCYAIGVTEVLTIV